MRAKLLVVIPVVLVLVLAGTATSMFPFREQSALEATMAATQQELDTLRFHNALLEAEAEALNGPSEIEKVAREELGYVFPGEVPYVVVESDTPTLLVEVEPPLDPAAPWYSKIVDFFTGRNVDSSL
jgi:cell division protein FtsB